MEPLNRMEASGLQAEWASDRASVVSELRALRDRIIEAFEGIETSAARFERTEWPYARGVGGGEMSVLRGGVFEKAAVNWSAVSGERFPSAGDTAERDPAGPFFATGVSLITHMKNPFAPTVHFNIRYIEAGKRRWLGGGYDLTPMGFRFEEDTQHFHQSAERALQPFGPGLYERLRDQAREYFYIPHRKKERGVGGIFFDHWDSGDWARDRALWSAVGESFLGAVMPIYERRVGLPYTAQDRLTQAEWRAHYVEFNLLYDRGTKFGFASGGNHEAILCSMPPTASW